MASSAFSIGLGATLGFTACGEAFDNGCRDTLTCPSGGTAGVGGSTASSGAGGTNGGGSPSGSGGLVDAAAGSGGEAGVTETEGGAAGAAGGGGVGSIGPACGNALVDVGEKCDDGNVKGGDGCSSTCKVESGYACTGEPSTCADIDECQTGADNCSAQATCKNAAGAYSCTCMPPFVGDGVTCVPRSCDGLPRTCGPSGNENCCESPVVKGGKFTLGYGTSMAIPATIADFALDKYEVTVGRFRQFVNAYAGHPPNGAGAHPLIPGSGWQSPAWDDQIAPDKDALVAAVQCDATYQTWGTQSANDTLPMNCVDWYEAFAFCAWDGGRLPTKAEWEYAAVGGGEQRTYPWGNMPLPTGAQDSTAAYAVFGCLGDGSIANDCAFADILQVGSRPSGAGKYGQLDMAGSMVEFAFDGDYPTGPSCDNCASISAPFGRFFQGGAYESDAASLPGVSRAATGAYYHRPYQGIRCARSL